MCNYLSGDVDAACLRTVLQISRIINTSREEEMLKREQDNVEMWVKRLQKQGMFRGIKCCRA